VRDDELGHVGQHQRHVLPALEAEAVQRPGEPAGQAVELGVGEPGVADDDGGALGVRASGAAEEGGEVEAHGISGASRWVVGYALALASPSRPGGQDRAWLAAHSCRRRAHHETSRDPHGRSLLGSSRTVSVHDDDRSLLSELPAVPLASWRARVEQALGQPVETLDHPTVEGPTVRALYSADDGEPEPRPPARAPGWSIALEYATPAPSALLAALRHDVERGLE